MTELEQDLTQQVEKLNGRLSKAAQVFKTQKADIERMTSERDEAQAEADKLKSKIKELEQKGVHNINLVSPSHFMPQIAMALDIYKPNIPIVYNSNGYDDADTLKKFAKYNKK